VKELASVGQRASCVGQTGALGLHGDVVNAMRSLTTTSMSLTTTLSPMMNFSNCLHDNWDGVDSPASRLLALVESR
jgi:hypothetical protein